MFDKGKILFISLWFYPQIGGMEVSNFDLVLGFGKTYQVTVITADHIDKNKFDPYQSFEINRCKGFYLNKLDKKNIKNFIMRYFYYIFYYLKFYFLVKKNIKKINPNHVIIGDYQTRNWFGFFHRFFKDNPIVITSMGEKKVESIKNKIKNKLAYSTYKDAAKIIVVSNYTKNIINETFDSKFDEKIEIIPRSLDNKFFEFISEKHTILKLKESFNLKQSFVLLTVSRLSKGKNITDLLIILKKVLNMGHDVKLIIVGDGPEKARINNKVSSLGLTDNVKMTGKIERNQIIDYFDISDCFVFTSNEESFGRVLIEANARKKVCISYKNGGSEEVIQDGYNGFLINQGDIDLFSLKIGFLIENKTVLDKMSINSFIFARNLYSSNVVINKYNKILDNI